MPSKLEGRRNEMKRSNRTRRVLFSLSSFALAAALGSAAGTVTAASPKASAKKAEEPAARPAVLVEPDGDPDLPPNAPAMDPAEYLRLRSEHIGVLRGVPDALALPYNPRVTAIRQLEKQLAANPQANTSTWTAIGPFPIPNGQTSPVVAVTGRVTCVAIKPTDPNVAYVGTAQGGVWRTLDGGTTWTPIFDTALSLAIGSIAIAPSNTNIVYVGTGEPNFSLDCFFGVGIYRINNAETTATLNGPFNSDGIGDQMTGRAVSKIIVHPTNPDMIWASTSSGFSGLDGALYTPLPARGVFRSSNATTTCTFTRLTVQTVANRAVTDMVAEPGNPDRLICNVFGNAAAGDGGIWLSTNATGVTPTFTQQLTASDVGRLAIQKTGATVTSYLLTNETSACSVDGLLRRSTDGGATWSASITVARGISGGQGAYDTPVAIDPVSANNVLIGGNATPSATSTCRAILKRSTDAGTTFTEFDGGLHADNHCIEYAPSNSNIIYTGNDGGIWKSTDAGTTWTSLNVAPFSATQFQSIATHPTDPHFTIGGTQDNGTNMYTPAAAWTRADFGDGGYSLIDQNAADNTNVTMYHTYFNQTNAYAYARVTNVANAVDNGWTSFGCGFTGITANGFVCSGVTSILFYAPMALGPGSPNTLYFGTDRLWRSPDSGATMTVVSQGPIVSTQAVSAIGVSRQNDNVRIVGLINGNIWATTTGSSTLTNVTQAGMPAKYVARAVIDPNNSNTAYVTFDGYGLAAGQHVWKTSNLNGAPPTWTAAGTGIPDVPTNAFLVDPRNSNHLFAGTDIGMYYSSDAGVSWNPLGTGLPRVAVFDMAMVNPSTPANRVLRIATHGRGMWELTPPTATTVTAPTGGGTFCPGSMVTLSVTATGQATLTYQWRKGMVNVTNGGGISGATSASLVFNPITAGDAGSYDCVVTAGSSDTATSTATALTAETTVPVVTAPAAATVTQTLCQ